MNDIIGYSNYIISDCGLIIYKKHNQKEITISITNGIRHYVKLKHDNGKWNSVPMSVVRSISGFKMSTNGYTKVNNKNGEYYINKYNQSIIVFSKTYPYGKIKNTHDHGGYVGIIIDGKSCTVHQLMAETFIDSEYIKKGLVCMHLDNNKKNNNLENLKVGTYSENNKQAYADGLNRGNADFYKKSY